MSEVETILHLAATDDFWRDYLWEDESSDREYPTLEKFTLAWAVCSGYRLSLEMSGLHYFSLGFTHPKQKKAIELGFDDQAHWHPNCLRWEELDLFGRLIALQDPRLPHPGLPVLLLNRFAPICTNTDAEVVFTLIETAWKAQGMKKGKRFNSRVERYDRRHAEFEWRNIQGVGWEIGQPEGADDRTNWDCYTLRSAENQSFPFAQWNAFVTACEGHYRSFRNPAWVDPGGTVSNLARVVAASGDGVAAGALADALEENGCDQETILTALRTRDAGRFAWVVEFLLDLPHGEVYRRLFKRTKRKQVSWFELDLHWPELRGKGAVSGRELVERLNAALGKAKLGRAEDNGASMSDGPSGETVFTATFISIQIRDDLDEGLRVVLNTLAQNHIPRSARLRQVTPVPRPIPIPRNVTG